MIQRTYGTKRPMNEAGGVMRRSVVLLASLLLVCVLMAGAVSAEEKTASTWDELKTNLTGSNTVTLTQDIEASLGELKVDSGSNPTLNLANYRLYNETQSLSYNNGKPSTKRNEKTIINVSGGTLKITGTNGKIESGWTSIVVTKGGLEVGSNVLINKIPNESGQMVHGPSILILGNTTSSSQKHSVVNISSGATVKGYGWGIIMGMDSANIYGMELDVSGTLTGNQTASDGTMGSGGLTVNGQLQPGNGMDITNGKVPEIRISQGATIAGNGTCAIYGAGYANWTITGGTFVGTEALGVKSGKWVISGGTFNGNGLFVDPAVTNTNGEEPTGAALSVTTNHGYAKNVSIIITGGMFTSTNQSAFYEASSMNSGKSVLQTGTALKKVAISGGTFTTNNASLSAVTIKNSGNSTIDGGISIKDSASGNNLLYRGVNLTSSSSTPNAKWGGDAESGYTLELKTAGSYKLMDAFTTAATATVIKVDADNVKLDGNRKKITTTAATVVISVPSGKSGTVIQNMDITSSGSTASNNLVRLESATTLKDSVFDFTGYGISTAQAMNGIYLYKSGAKDSQIVNNTIKNGNSNTARSQAIVVDDADNVTIQGNTITPGKQTTVTSKDNESVGIRLYNSTNNTKILNNTITSTQSDRPNVGLLIDVNGAPLFHKIQGNTFTFAASPQTAVIELVPKMDNAKLSLDMSDNTIGTSTHGIYVNFTDKGKKPITLIGTIYNNNFSGITGSFFANDSAYDTFTDSAAWNVTPTTSFSGHKKIVDGQSYLAGNWWGTWSENRKSTNGYLTLTAKDAGLPVADLAPLVSVGQETTFNIVTGLPSGNALNLSNTSQKTGTFTVTPATAVTWTSSNQSVMTITSEGSYTAIAVGNTTITATSASDSTRTATVLITVFKPVEAKNATKSVTKGADGKVTIETNAEADITLSTDRKTATIDNADSNVKLTVTYQGQATKTGAKVEGTVSSFDAAYKPITIVPPTDGPATAVVQLTITSNNDEGLTNADKLPIISPVVDDAMKQRFTTQKSGVSLAAMITATDTFDSYMGDSGKITFTFTLPATWFITKNLDLNSVRIYYIPTDASGAIEEHKYTKFEPSGSNYVITATVDRAVMCGWALGAKAKTPTPPVPPQPVYSSGDGNMDGAYRVLFETNGGSFISPATGLSAGDKITLPAAPTKEGSSFVGWYKDAACTQGWSFSETIDGDMTLYAKWSGGSSSPAASATTVATAKQTTKQTTAPVQTQSQGASATTAVPAATTAAGGQPATTEAPAPVFGLLAGLLAAGVLLRRRE